MAANVTGTPEALSSALPSLSKNPGSYTKEAMCLGGVPFVNTHPGHFGPQGLIHMV